MQYLIDTNVIVRHFAQIGKIGKEAKAIIKEGENNQHQLIISVISLMEVMFLAEKNRIKISFDKTIQLILSTAKFLDIPILSSDKRFKEVDGIEVDLVVIGIIYFAIKSPTNKSTSALLPGF